MTLSSSAIEEMRFLLAKQGLVTHITSAQHWYSALIDEVGNASKQLLTDFAHDANWYSWYLWKNKTKIIIKDGRIVKEVVADKIDW